MCNFEKELKICAVIVTYGDRFHLLKQVIEACFREGINKVIVVDNASVENSRKQLKKFEKENKNRLKVIYLDENTGSAGGYKRGLEEAYNCEECDYILTLDDDNILPNNFLIKIKSILTYLDNFSRDEIMLNMYRPIFKSDKQIVNCGVIKGNFLPNNFIGFNFWKAVFLKLKKYKENNKFFFPLQPILVGAMGGSFFHKRVINKIGYPNEDFIIYADDFDYTHRFVDKGGKIFYCSNIIIKDIDITNKANGKNISYFDKEFPEFKLYYGIRNHTYISKRFITNKVFFYGNLVVVSLLHLKNIFKTPLPLFIRRYKLYLKAVKDGLNNRLGRTF